MEVEDYLKKINTQLDAQAVDISKRLRKDQPDSTAFNISVAASATMDNAVRKSELVGGLLRPFRLFSNVGTAETGATLRNGQQAQIVDALGLGMAYRITNIKITAIQAALVAATITIKSNGVVVYTQTVALLSLPAVGKVIDILGFASSQPVNITLPATLTCSSSAGTYEIFVDGVLI